MTDKKNPMRDNTPEHFARAARFYDGSPTGQYDDEAAHALRCHHELLAVLKGIARYRGEGPATTPWQDIVRDIGEAARAAIAKVEGAST